ncbi:hypothetical protein EHQ53_09695 [Leptospira langatensis]|uniref:DUF4013 domain-containing protein n=1 Tax=Leptospira langatensis TaxID=2484983 RepID=A0A5F1ZSP5_9LEPT|nr:hypothetical protein [Leptospira langatensis]TGK00290.1 hypothetical protein EHO57_13495 [Leptospira langatensis]TGL41074.1 hypothetical protein EHQ53_09695 [Leptospira langatensis]
MFKEYLRYLLGKGQVRAILAIRSVLLILVLAAVPSMQAGGAVALLFVPLVLALLGTYVANGYVIRSGMDPKKPVALPQFLVFFLLLVVFVLVLFLLLNFLITPFIGPETKAAFEKYAKDPSKPMPEELTRLYLITPFLMGLVFYLIVPVLFAKLNILQGLKALLSSIKRSDYVVAAWTPYVIMFVPTLVMFLISGSEEMVTSFFGQIVILFVLFFSLTSDIFLQYPTFYLIKTEEKPEEPNE